MTKDYWLKDAYGNSRSFYVEDKIELSFNYNGWDDSLGTNIKKEAKKLVGKDSTESLMEILKELSDAYDPEKCRL